MATSLTAPRCALRAPVARAPLGRIAAPVLQSRFQKRSAIPVVRAAEAEQPGAAEDAALDEVEFDMNADPRAQQRELAEDKRQAGRGRGRGRDDDDEGGGGYGGRRKDDDDDGFEDKIIQLNRVTKVLKGGKLMRFRAVVVVGNRAGTVGVGIASAREIVDAVTRATTKAKKAAITVPITPQRSFPHKIQVKEGAARIMLRPASEGTGVIAGGAVRVVLELAGFQNGFGKIYGTNSAMNNAQGTVAALSQMRTWKDVAAARGVTIDYAMGRVTEPNQIAPR